MLCCLVWKTNMIKWIIVSTTTTKMVVNVVYNHLLINDDRYVQWLTCDFKTNIIWKPCSLYLVSIILYAIFIWSIHTIYSLLQKVFITSIDKRVSPCLVVLGNKICYRKCTTCPHDLNTDRGEILLLMDSNHNNINLEYSKWCVVLSLPHSWNINRCEKLFFYHTCNFNLMRYVLVIMFPPAHTLNNG